MDRTAYRIVQESLTNITRHAAATASVRIDYRPDALAIQVDDDGRATPDTAPAPGVGLLGMRERVTALGGRFRAEPRREGWLHRPGRTSRGSNGMIRVLLVDDQPLIRSGFRALLEVEDDIEVVAEAADGRAGLALAKEYLPDIALMDIQMPRPDSLSRTSSRRTSSTPYGSPRAGMPCSPRRSPAG